MTSQIALNAPFFVDFLINKTSEPLGSVALRLRGGLTNRMMNPIELISQFLKQLLVERKNKILKIDSKLDISHPSSRSLTIHCVQRIILYRVSFAPQAAGNCMIVNSKAVILTT